MRPRLPFPPGSVSGSVSGFISGPGIAGFAAIAALGLALSAAPAGAEKIRGTHAGLEQCGDDLVTARACPDCTPGPVFELGGYWHKLAQCTRDMRDLWRRGGADQPTDLPGAPEISDLARNEIVQAMREPEVVFLAGGRRLRFDAVFDAALAPRQPFAQAMLTNDLGQPYNAMGQTGLALTLYQLAALAEAEGSGRDAALYRALARGAVATVLAPVTQGGLASTRPCPRAPAETCTWYHSITRRDRPAAAGATLNQMLHAVRDLGIMARLARRQGWDEPFDFTAAAEAGLNQLILAGPAGPDTGPGIAPGLADFLSTARGPNSARWAWYGLAVSDTDRARGYFLKNAEKNCSYHVHVLQLIDAVLTRAREDGRARTARALAFAPGTALPEFIRAAGDAPLGQVTPRIDCPARAITRSRRALSGLEQLEKRP